jgi:hypothetical protein
MEAAHPLMPRREPKASLEASFDRLRTSSLIVRSERSEPGTTRSSFEVAPIFVGPALQDEGGEM